jgi:hypothetical protein
MSINVCCDWCGAYFHCEKCKDPEVAKMMQGLDNPMDSDQGGHIHACCDAHELYWEDAHFATSLENVPAEEIAAMLPTLTGVRHQIAIAGLAEGE